MVGYGPESGISIEKNNAISIRPYQDKDCGRVVEITRNNFRLFYAPLFPKDVVDAYIAANRAVDLRSAVRTDGTEAYVAETPNGDVVGFCLIRYNPYTRRDPQGELDVRRLHVDPDNKRQRIGTRLFEFVEQRGKNIGVELLVSLASGSSRPFFEQNGWSGRTELHPMPKRRTSALVYAAQKRIMPEPIPLSELPTHVVYAGTNSRKEQFIRTFISSLNPNIVVYSTPTQEDPSEDVFEVARLKALGVKLNFGRNITPLIIASDIRTELLRADLSSPTRYVLVKRGKPKSGDPIEEIRANFALLLDTARQTEKPAPYVVRCATYLHNPLEPDRDSFSEHDTSVWLSREGLEELSTPEGLKRYRDEVNDRRADITQMSAGFALPMFLNRGYVVGLNGHPFDLLPKREQVVNKSLDTALVGIDPSLVKRRLGYLQP